MSIYCKTSKMDNTKNNKRRDFLMNVCPTVAMAFLGITVLDSCSSGYDDDSDYGTGSNNNNSGNGSGNNSTDQGYTVSGNTITINLDHSMFSTLQSNGWLNFSAQNMLLLKVDSSNYRAFNNACPHKGARSWTYSNNQFRCNSHGNSYKSDCSSPSVSPSSNSTSGALECYNTSVSNSTLTVTK